MKKEYRTPEMEIVAFETEDIITTSDALNEWDTSFDDSIDEELV